MINIVEVVIFMAKTKEESIYVIDTVVKITDHRAIGKILQLHFWHCWFDNYEVEITRTVLSLVPL